MCNPRCAGATLIRRTGKILNSRLICRLTGITRRTEADRIDMVRLVMLDRIAGSTAECWAETTQFRGGPLVQKSVEKGRTTVVHHVAAQDIPTKCDALREHCFFLDWFV